MPDLEKLKTWLATYPGWEDDKPFFVDDAAPKPGCVGLFPQGLEQVSLRRDITGGQKAACRYRFYLYRASALEENQEENARWLLDFQNWVEAQSAGGLAPRFGDVPQEERLREVCAYEIQSRDERGVCVRFVTSWATTEEDVDGLLAFLQEVRV